MNPEQTYKVRVSREGDAWIADVTNLVGAHTFSRSYASLQREVLEVIRLVDDLDDSEEVDVDYEFADFDEDFVALSKIGDRRAELEDENRRLSRTMATLILSMKDKYSVRDIAAALHITPGRVSQIVNRPTMDKPQLQLEDLQAEFGSREDRTATEQRRVQAEVSLATMQPGRRR